MEKKKFPNILSFLRKMHQNINYQKIKERFSVIVVILVFALVWGVLLYIEIAKYKKGIP